MKKRIPVVLIGLTTFVGVAAADTVSMEFDGTGKGSTVRASFFTNDPFNVFAGQLRHTITAGTGQAVALLGEHRTFCADFEQHVSSASNTFTVVTTQDLLVRGSPLGAARAAALAGIYSAFGHTAIAADASNNLGTAFQLAVWEILYDYDPNVGASSISLTGGNIRFTKTDGSGLSSGIVNQFNAVIAAIGSVESISGLFGLQSATRQDQLIYGNNLIPSPGAAALAGLGLLAASRRRRSR